MNKRLIHRTLAESLNAVFRYFPVITLTGPRQSGKTTLCREMFPDLPYANLEDASVLVEMQTDAKAFLSKYPHGAIIDEAQNYPEIFSYLQVMVDEDRHQGRNDRHFIVTGSNNFALMERITQSMAGRTAVLTLLPLSVGEILSHDPGISTTEMILNGGYPAVWDTDSDARRIIMANYYTTYIERDVRTLINVKDLRAFQTFIRLCAGRVGAEFNASALSVEVGVAVNTIRNWLSILAASYVVYLLQPYYTNIGKRLTKTPKMYFYDTGLAAFLMGISTKDQLDIHPMRGPLFENMVINDIMKHGTNRGEDEMLYFYRDKSQREVDVIRVMPDTRVEAYEIKSGMTYSTDYFKNLRYLRPLLKDKILRTTVIYDGTQENNQPFDGICNFRNIPLD